MNTRGLWSAVVLQAKTDLETQHYTSVAYGQAKSFFLAAGEWAESRQAIADCIGVHTEELTRLGRMTIAARHLLDGGRDAITEDVAQSPQRDSQQPAPNLTHPAPAATKHPRRYAQRAGTELHNREWFIQRFLKKEGAT
jgi:hypothetical protein